jgi:hypothetical protein
MCYARVCVRVCVCVCMCACVRVVYKHAMVWHLLCGLDIDKSSLYKYNVCNIYVG